MRANVEVLVVDDSDNDAALTIDSLRDAAPEVAVLRLTDGQRRTAFWAGLIAAYAGLAANAFGAINDLPGPASNPGVAAPMPQAALFFTLLAIIVPALFVTVGLAIYGLRGDDA